jgi:hypothetical protein
MSVNLPRNIVVTVLRHSFCKYGYWSVRNSAGEGRDFSRSPSVYKSAAMYKKFVTMSFYL